MTTTLCAVVDKETQIVLSTQQVTDPVEQQAPPAGATFVPCDNTVAAGAQYNNPSDGVFAPAGSPLISAAALNRATIRGAIAGALVRLRQIQTQAAAGKAHTVTLAGKANYATANLASLNDLLATVKAVGADDGVAYDAIGDIATDLIGLVRILSNQFDGTT